MNTHYYPMFDRNQPEVVAYASGDVTGDNIPDSIFLTGTKSGESPFIENITLVIQDGRTGAFATIKLKENRGYSPTLFLGDFTGNGVKDIFISIATGGSGGIMNHFIYSYFGNNSQLIFDSNQYNEQYKYRVEYQDFYKVLVESLYNRQRYIIDISLRNRDYLNEIYDQNGKLKSPITGFVNPLSGLYPIDFDGNGVFELLAYQRIAGRYNADSLGYILNTLGWNQQSFQLQNQLLALFGN